VRENYASNHRRTLASSCNALVTRRSAGRHTIETWQGDVFETDSVSARSDDSGRMRILIATNAWQPQVNGVMRTLTSLARTLKALDATVEFLSPEGFPLGQKRLMQCA